ncbi:MAG: hypothetical protein JWQ09_5561 [Segetibacter sp.]|nr:hypothetical protein [Segetibacter sp.]
MENIDVKKYREAAEFLSTTVLELLEIYAETLAAPVIGGAYYFSRPTSAARTISRKIKAMEDQVRDGIETLNTLVAIKEIEKKDTQMPPFIEELMLKQANFYINFFEKYKNLELKDEDIERREQA